MRQPSSTTTIRFAARSSVSASICACSQAVAQVMRIPSAVVWVFRTARRLRTTSGRVEVEPGRGRSVEHALEISGAQLVDRERHGAHCVRDLADLHRERVRHLTGGVDEDVDDGGERRLPVRATREYGDRLLTRLASPPASADVRGLRRRRSRGG